jgi:hypothetical protein
MLQGAAWQLMCDPLELTTVVYCCVLIVLWQAIGVVYAPPNDVFKLLMDVSPLRRDVSSGSGSGAVAVV